MYSSSNDHGKPWGYNPAYNLSGMTVWLKVSDFGVPKSQKDSLNRQLLEGKLPFKLNQIRQGLSWLEASIMRFQRDLMRLAWIFLFSHENASTNAAKRNGSWAHQQIDKITPSTTKWKLLLME